MIKKLNYEGNLKEIKEKIDEIIEILNNLTKHNSQKIQSAKRVDKINKNFKKSFNKGRKQLENIGKLL